MPLRNISIVGLLLFCSTLISAQQRDLDLLDVTYLEYVDYLPKNLITHKSIGVLIADTREEGEKMAELVHPDFAKSGIDVVAYYYADDLFGGQEISPFLADQFVKREIAQMIILEKIDNRYRVVITPFSKDDNFLKQGKKAWQMEVGDITDASNTMYRLASKLERKNFLVNDAAEMGSIDHKIKGRRYEAFKPDLTKEKLAVELFQPIELPEEVNGKAGYDEVKKAVDEHNRQVIINNAKLKATFSNYPFPVVFLEESMTEKELRNKGHNYVLRSAYSTSNVLRNIFKYEKKSGVTDYIVVRMKGGQGEILRVNGEAPVYKYYIRNIPSDSYYLGTKWDVDYTWEAALNNHLQLLVAEIE